MRKVLLTICIWLAIASNLFGQSAQPPIELSAKHQRKLSTITDSTERATLYQKYFKKDSTKQVKRWLKEQAKSTVQPLASEHLGVTELPTDSASMVQEAKNAAQKTINEQEFVQQNKEYIDLVKLDSANRPSIDSVAVKNTLKKKGEELLNTNNEYKELMGGGEDSEFDQLTDYKDKIEKTQEELQQMAAQDELKKQMTSKAKDYIMQNAGQLQEVQGQMSELKSMYSAVPNSNDLSTATKRSSLKGEPFWKRFFLGGNFSIPSLDPITMDLSPQIGYRIDKRFEAGISGTYRVEFKRDSTWTPKREEKYGFSVFADYLFYKNFFAYIEGEMMNTADPLASEVTRSWKETLLIGVGRKFNITKSLQMHAIVSFNVLHNNRDGLYNSPVVFKTGFRVKK